MVKITQMLISICFISFLSTVSFAVGKEVVIASDCGTEVDDQWAIIETLISPQINVRGFMSTHAPNLPFPGAVHSAECINDIVHNVLKLSGPQVYEGDSTPLKNLKLVQPSAATNFLLNESKGHTKDNPLIIISLGATTDIGAALLTDPTLADRAQIWMMGFLKWPGGGREWNIENDPRAAYIILESNIPVVALSSEVSHSYLNLTFQEITNLLGSRQDQPSRWLYSTTMEYLKKHSREFPKRDKVFFDIGVLGALFKMGTFQLYNRPHLNRDLTFNFQGPSRGNFAWVESIQANLLWADFTSKLDAFSKGH